MSVIGIGTDIIDISRIAKMKASTRLKLAERVLTARELEQYQKMTQSIAFLAKRWAGKEAAAKALGTGIANGISFQHFDIQSLPSGQPVLVLTQRAHQIALELGASSWHISLSDEIAYATAFVVISK